jgi:hypothetical protein
MVGDFFWDLPIFAQMSEQTTGIVIMAFGKAAYHEMAYNFALSVKHFDRDLPIQLICDKNDVLMGHKYWVFDIITIIDNEDLYHNNVFSPGRAKTRIDKYMAFDNNLYFDIDGVAVVSLRPLVDHLLALPKEGFFYSQTASWTDPKGRTPMANLKQNGPDFPEMQWATLDTIWEYHELPDDAMVTAINSSFMFLRKGKKLTQFFEQVRDNIDNGIPVEKLKMPWGGTYPDELAFNIACAQFGIDPWCGLNPVFFQFRNAINGKTVKWIYENYFVLGLYGGAGFSHNSAWEMSCKLLGQYHAAMGLTHEYKWHSLVKQKHAGKQKQLIRWN